MNTENTQQNIELTIDAKIESFLFWKGETVSVKEIAKALTLTTEEIRGGLDTLKERLMGRGISLIETGEYIELRTTPAMSSVIEKLTKEELDRDLGKAGLETLSIILYEGPVSRREIDYIRGVNSQFIVRNLLVRGLIERVQGKDGRSFDYKPTPELLAHLGISSEKDLPEFAAYRQELETFKKAKVQDEPQEHGQTTDNETSSS